MIPPLATRPTVGFRPTIPFAAAGDMIEPSVSVPIDTGVRPAATAAAEPELDPPGLRSGACGLWHWPPIALHPLLEGLPRKFAHSERFALAMTTIPASRRRP